MSAYTPRRPGGPSSFFSGPPVAFAALISAVVIIGLLWAVGLIDLSKFRSAAPSTAGLVAVPTPARKIPAFTKLTRDHLWDLKNGRIAVLYLPPRSVTPEMLVHISDVLGRVLDQDRKSVV